MNSGAKGSLERLASEIADGEPIDWERAKADHAGELDRLSGLQLLDTVGRAFRGASSSEGSGGRDEPMLFRWGPLDVVEKLGEGSFGEVYRAVDRQLGRPVALKLRKRSADGRDSEWIAEARRLARLRHPNVLTVHGAGSHDDRVGLWTELLSGTDLRQRLAEDGPLGFAQLVAVGDAVCGALTAIHEAGMVHGDIKASNVFQETNGNVVLLDFGSGSDLAAAQASSSLHGSPLTSAPEVLAGGKALPASDLYSLAAMLYLLATGHPPIDTEDYDELQRRAVAGMVSPLARSRPDLPSSFTSAIHRALEAEPENRFPSSEAFGAALRGGLETTTAEAKPTEVGRAHSIPARALLLLVVLAACAAVWWVLSGEDPAPALRVHAELLLAGAHDEPLADGATVRPGERLALAVEVDQPTHLYLLNEDERGDSFVLFPLPGVHPSNPLPPGSHRLPGVIDDEPQNWVVTSSGGTEHFLVIASAQPLASVESFIEHTRKAGSGAVSGSDRAPGGDPAERRLGMAGASGETVRGVGGLAPVGSPALQTLEGLRLSLRESGQDVWQRWIRLDNPP